ARDQTVGGAEPDDRLRYRGDHRDDAGGRRRDADFAAAVVHDRREDGRLAAGSIGAPGQREDQSEERWGYPSYRHEKPSFPHTREERGYEADTTGSHLPPDPSLEGVHSGTNGAGLLARDSVARLPRAPKHPSGSSSEPGRPPHLLAAAGSLTVAGPRRSCTGLPVGPVRRYVPSS